jgi:hypothetical protein
MFLVQAGCREISVDRCVAGVAGPDRSPVTHSEPTMAIVTMMHSQVTPREGETLAGTDVSCGMGWLLEGIDGWILEIRPYSVKTAGAPEFRLQALFRLNFILDYKCT